MSQDIDKPEPKTIDSEFASQLSNLLKPREAGTDMGECAYCGEMMLAHEMYDGMHRQCRYEASGQFYSNNTDTTSH